LRSANKMLTYSESDLGQHVSAFLKSVSMSWSTGNHIFVNHWNRNIKHAFFHGNANYSDTTAFLWEVNRSAFRSALLNADLVFWELDLMCTNVQVLKTVPKCASRGSQGHKCSQIHVKNNEN
jgi:hypothetical protein